MTDTERPPVVGFGEIVGPTRDDGWPSGFASLQCDLCGATWTGPEGESCWWCQQRLDGMIAHQHEIDTSRFRDYCKRLRDGDMTALEPAIGLAIKLDLTRQLAKILEAA